MHFFINKKELENLKLFPTIDLSGTYTYNAWEVPYSQFSVTYTCASWKIFKCLFLINGKQTIHMLKENEMKLTCSYILHPNMKYL